MAGEYYEGWWVHPWWQMPFFWLRGGIRYRIPPCCIATYVVRNIPTLFTTRHKRLDMEKSAFARIFGYVPCGLHLWMWKMGRLSSPPEPDPGPDIGGMPLREWEMWLAFMEHDADGNPFRGGFVNMNRDDGWSLTTTHNNHMKSIAMDEHGIGYL